MDRPLFFLCVTHLRHKLCTRVEKYEVIKCLGDDIVKEPTVTQSVCPGVCVSSSMGQRDDIKSLLYSGSFFSTSCAELMGNARSVPLIGFAITFFFFSLGIFFFQTHKGWMMFFLLCVMGNMGPCYKIENGLQGR